VLKTIADGNIAYGDFFGIVHGGEFEGFEGFLVSGFWLEKNEMF
jgi:hypothetical protein